MASDRTSAGSKSGDGRAATANRLFPTRIETPRLRFEPRTPDAVDVLDLYEICAHDEGIERVTRYVPWDPHETPKETLDLVERGIEAHESGESAAYVIRVCDGEESGGTDAGCESEDAVEAGAIAGLTGISFDWERRTGALGLWLRERFWGRGYSGERATAMAELAFDALDLEYLTVGHVSDNEQSRRAIEKYVARLGGERDGTFRNRIPWPDGPPRDEVRYAIPQAEWREAVGDERIATVRWD